MLRAMKSVNVLFQMIRVKKIYVVFAEKRKKNVNVKNVNVKNNIYIYIYNRWGYVRR